MKKTEAADNRYHSLKPAFNQMLHKPGSKAILPVGQTTPNFSCTILHENNTSYLFDPRSARCTC